MEAIEKKMELNDAIRIAKREAKNPAAQAYLQAIPTSIEEYGSHGFQVQLLYVLNNLSTWRGDSARECKAVIKSFLKSKGHRI